MEFVRFKKTWGAALREIAVKDLIIAALTAVNLIAVFGWFRSHETVVLVPPTLDERVRVSSNDASEAYRKSWAMYVSMLMGNVSPGNVEFVVSSLEGIMSPETYRSIKEALAKQMEDIRADSLTVRFEPHNLVYETDTRTAFVYGKFTTQGPSGDPTTFYRTYEMKVDMRFGRPWVTYFDAYTGQPQVGPNRRPARDEDRTG